MIYLHKTLPLIVSPLGLVFFLVVVFLYTGRRLILWLMIAFLWVVSTPIVGNYLFQSLEEPYEKGHPNNLTNAEAVVVLSGMLNAVHGPNRPLWEWQDPDRFFGGLEVFRSGKADKLIFTRGQLPWQSGQESEGDFLKSFAVDYGIPPNRILLTNIVQNTQQEAEAVATLLKDTKEKQIILVTSAFHMSRAEQLFVANGFEVQAYAVDFKTSPSSLTPMSFIPSASGLNKTSRFVREKIGRAYYSLKQ